MYFEIKGSSVRLAGTMHRVPKGRPLAHWVNDGIGWARVIYLEHDKEESDRLRLAPPGSQPIARRLLRSWPRINLTFSDRRLVVHLATLRPSAVASDVLGQFQATKASSYSPLRDRKTLRFHGHALCILRQQRDPMHPSTA